VVWKFVRVSDERSREETTASDERSREETTASDERSREETTASDERVVPNRWQWSVTTGFEGVDGATAVASGEDPFVDPQGNEFSVVRSGRRAG
jgi:hypothetical protein